MKKVMVDEELLNVAATCVEQANIYLNALRKIAGSNASSEDAKNLVEIARTAIKDADDTGVLSQTEFGDEAQQS